MATDKSCMQRWQEPTNLPIPAAHNEDPQPPSELPTLLSPSLAIKGNRDRKYS